ncbi:CBS domain-containing protein [Nocardia sp. NBC_01503]|uniref:CBS domain-containing protein n=1 Tax=Nocardia sp. NBC_01503 TaxID=2975997 RepID=UPI002E7BFAFD|nr:CBS domain-containing protein [Nocardia sp. NBC_01503]WTL30637.1 CBS domain-containing protein [Nocardia sp. NBC_01503]
MRHNHVADVMTREVVTVRRHAQFHEIARLLATHRISGVPVVDADGRVTGIVTEADLLLRHAQAGGAGPGPVRRRLHRRAISRRLAARTAAELMTTPVITVRATDRLSTAAALLARHGVKRLPVVDANGKPEGILSRRDVLSIHRRSDSDIADEIRGDVLTAAMCVPPSDVSVGVTEGVVSLQGKVERQSMIDIITRLVASVDGVIYVHHELTTDFDDTHLPPPEPENVGILHRFIEPRESPARQQHS